MVSLPKPTFAVLFGVIAGLCSCAYGANRPDNLCGDNAIDPGELCDGEALGGFTCATLPGYPFTGGTLACDFRCSLDTSGCMSEPGACGNGVQEGAEACDLFDLGGETCGSQGLEPGQLGCLPDCSGFDQTQCGMPSTCGDGVREGIEECDQSDFAGATCMVLGYAGGTLECQTNCQLDESDCHDGLCGNSVIETGEQCDGAAFGGETCTTQGFTGGDLACSSICMIDVSGCTSTTCGNGIADGNDHCDGSDLNGQDCSTMGFNDGTLLCASNCTFDTSSCNMASGCALLPFHESFETSVPPAGGHNLNGGGPSLLWESQSLTAHEGSSSAYHNRNASENDNDILVLQCLDLSSYAGQTITMTFWEQNTLNIWYDGHYVVYSTSPTAPLGVANYTTLQEMGAGFNSWLEATLDLTFLAGQSTVWIGFRYTGSGADNWYLDDISVTAN